MIRDVFYSPAILIPLLDHYGCTKTWRRVAERFYWKGLCNDAKDLVSILPVYVH